MKKRNFPIYKIFCLCSLDHIGYFNHCTNRMGILGIFEITVGTG